MHISTETMWKDECHQTKKPKQNTIACKSQGQSFFLSGLLGVQLRKVGNYKVKGEKTQNHLVCSLCRNKYKKKPKHSFGVGQSRFVKRCCWTERQPHTIGCGSEEAVTERVRNQRIHGQREEEVGKRPGQLMVKEKSKGMAKRRAQPWSIDSSKQTSLASGAGKLDQNRLRRRGNHKLLYSNSS